MVGGLSVRSTILIGVGLALAVSACNKKAEGQTVAIVNGEERRIGTGDVLIVPAGTPHWFKEVPGPLNYYVVKVR